MRKSADVVIPMQPSSNYTLLYPRQIEWESYVQQKPDVPFADNVIAIHKALSVKGHEILFVQTAETVEMLVGGIRCNKLMNCKSFQGVSIADGFGFIMDGYPFILKPI